MAAALRAGAAGCDGERKVSREGQHLYTISTRCECCGAVVPKVNRHQSYVCRTCKASTAEERKDPLRTCKACGAQKKRSEWQRDVSGHLAKHCGCRASKYRDCELCGIKYQVNTPRQKHCKQCQPKAAQAQRNRQKDEARRARGCKLRLHDAHVRRYVVVVKKRTMEEEREAAKIGPPHPSKVSSAVYHRWRIRTNAHALINMRMRVAIRKALAGGKAGRTWESLVGYTVEQLATHLQRQLPKGYTLDDLFGGKLHIDHIIPKSSFDVTNPEELRACWALPNLRPLGAKQNMKKGAKRVTLL